MYKKNLINSTWIKLIADSMNKKDIRFSIRGKKNNTRGISNTFTKTYTNKYLHPAAIGYFLFIPCTRV